MIGASLCSALASFDELLDKRECVSRYGVGCVEEGTRAAGSSATAVRAIATTARSCASPLELGTGRVH